MTNKASSFPSAQPVGPLGRHGGKISALYELPIHALGNDYTLEGSGTVQRLPSLAAGITVALKTTGTPTFVNSTNLVCPGGINNYTAQIGDLILARSDGSGVWRLYVLPSVTVGAMPGHCETIINKSVNIDQIWEGNPAYADGSNTWGSGTRLTENYGPDNWRLGANSGTGVFYGRRIASSAFTGFSNALQLVVTTADTSSTPTNNYHVEVPISGPRMAPYKMGTVDAQPMTVQFRCGGVNGLKAVSLVEGTTDGYSCTRTFNYTGGGAAQTFVVTFPGDTNTGHTAWTVARNTCAAKLIFDMGCGSSFETSSVGVWNTGLFLRTPACARDIATTSTNYITGLQADVGSFALPPPFRPLSEGEDLRDCQYHVRKTFPIGTAVAANAGANNALTYLLKSSGATVDGVEWEFGAMQGTPSNILTFCTGASSSSKWFNNGGSPTQSGTATPILAGDSRCFILNNQLAGDTNLTALMTLHCLAVNRIGTW